MEVDLMPSIGTGISNQSSPRGPDHGPMATTRQSQGTGSASFLSTTPCTEPSSPLTSPSASPIFIFVPIFCAASIILVATSRGVTCAVLESIWVLEAFPFNQGAAFLPFLPPETESVCIGRNDSIFSSFANSACIRKEILWRASVGPLPQSRARKPPAFPLAAAATPLRSTTVMSSEFPPFFARWYAVLTPWSPAPKITTLFFTPSFPLIFEALSDRQETGEEPRRLKEGPQKASAAEMERAKETETAGTIKDLHHI
mmetsp:Transcript_2738/g.5672  ORF Transcript_2738/g.5672 Transcript_2738/m.5672 type:complete len:257 (-) Transcript_2738:109-879(-)